MEFVMLESRGGNYLVVAQNIAWLRTAENGQTSVGIVGGQPLLVVGSIQDVADKILTAASEAKSASAEPAAAAQPAVPEPAPTPVVAEVPAPQPEAEPEPAPPPEPVCEAVADTAPPAKPSERTRPIPARPMTLSDRLALTVAPKVTAGSQRFMGVNE
ncbi:MAG: hypothetical protein NBV60_07725 [Erythrobacter sp.]|nr:hypothetical protein [Erythrobacter sp.]